MLKTYTSSVDIQPSLHLVSFFVQETSNNSGSPTDRKKLSAETPFAGYLGFS